MGWANLGFKSGERGFVQADLLLLGKSFFPEFVPSAEVSVPVLGNIFWLGMKWEMGGNKGKVLKEGLVCVVLLVLL